MISINDMIHVHIHIDTVVEGDMISIYDMIHIHIHIDTVVERDIEIM